jgi:hypothetical protein
MLVFCSFPNGVLPFSQKLISLLHAVLRPEAQLLKTGVDLMGQRPYSDIEFQKSGDGICSSRTCSAGNQDNGCLRGGIHNFNA